MKLVSNVKNRVKTNVNSLVKTIKYYFYYAPQRFVMLKYYKLYELVAYKLLATTTVMVRQLIIRQGKNPDYVAPLPLPAPEPVLTCDEPKRRPQISVPFVPSWVRTSFKNISNHPIYKSRVNLNLRPNYLPKISEPVSEPLQVVLAPEILICDQCAHPDHDGMHTCESFKPKETLPEVVLSVPENDISVSDTGELLFNGIAPVKEKE